MHIRKILICVLTGLLCLGILCPKAADAAQTPQEFVKEFYEWYFIKYNELVDILKEEKLPEYVDESLIKYLKEKEASDLYYFIQHGETTAFDNCSVTVKDVVAMKNGVFVVPVAFNGENFEYYVIVYVKKLGQASKLLLYQMFTHIKLQENPYEKKFPCMHIPCHEPASAMPTSCTRARRGSVCTGLLQMVY